MNNTKLTNFRRVKDMPERVMTQCRTLGQRAHGHLRDIIIDYRDNECGRWSKVLRSSYVLEVNDIVVGWACLYEYQGSPCVGVWVRTRHRRKGYGKLLMDIAWKRWKHMNPRTYKTCCDYWKAKHYRQMERRRIKS